MKLIQKAPKKPKLSSNQLMAGRVYQKPSGEFVIAAKFSGNPNPCIIDLVTGAIDYGYKFSDYVEAENAEVHIN